MSGWIKIEKSLVNDPRVLRMASRLRNADVTPMYAQCTVIGALVKLWCYADTHLRKDNTLDIGPAEVDMLVGISGFCEAMPDNWLRIVDVDTVELPEFQEHNGIEAKRRAMTQQRVAKHRRNLNDPVGLVKSSQASVFERDGHSCVYCGRHEGEFNPPTETEQHAKLTLDHVIPTAQGGSNDPPNLVTACWLCNNRKGSRTPEQAGMPWPVDKSGRRYGLVTKSLPDQDQDQDHKNIGRQVDRFEEFWKKYPRRVKKKPSHEIWKRKKLDSKADQIIQDIDTRLKSDRRWLEGYIPDPTTYLNQERWNDELQVKTSVEGRPETDFEKAVRIARERGLEPFRGAGGDPPETKEQFIARVDQAMRGK